MSKHSNYYSGIPLGQYFPGCSLIHRLDPRSKVLLVLAVVVMAFVVNSFLFLTGLAATTLALFGMAKIPFGFFWRQLRAFSWLGIVIFFLYWFFSHGNASGLNIEAVTPTKFGALEGLRYLLKMFVFVFSGLLFTATTSALDLVNSVRSLSSVFKRPIRFLEDTGLLFYLAVGFVPLLAREAQEIKKAQQARGADFSGKIWQRIKKSVPLVFPLIVNSFRRAEEKALALEVRGYRSEKPPTTYPPRQFGTLDWLVTVVALGLTGLAIIR